MTPPRNNKAFFSFVDAGIKLFRAFDADALLVLLTRSTDWTRLKKKTASYVVVVATHDLAIHEAAIAEEIPSIHLEIPEASVQNQLTQAVLASVASEFVKPGSTIVSIYGGFDTEDIDTISVLKLTERLGRLTARDLRKLETKVPLDTLKTVVDLAVAIGREGAKANLSGPC